MYPNDQYPPWADDDTGMGDADYSFGYGYADDQEAIDGLAGKRREARQTAIASQQPGVTQLRQRKTFFGKALQTVSRGVTSVGLAPVRNAWLLAMKLNVKGIAAKLRFGYVSAQVAAQHGYDARQWNIIRGQLIKAQNSFVQLGGKAENLKRAILTGKGNGHHDISGLDGGGDEPGGLAAILAPITAILEALASVLNQVRPAAVNDPEGDMGALGAAPAPLAFQSKVPVAYRLAFVEKVRAIANRLGIQPDWLMVVMNFESAGTFRPDIKNGSAVGLIQFTPAGIKGWGITLNQLGAMSAVDQLDWVEYYLSQQGKGSMKSVYDVYLAVFAPAYLGKPDSQVLYSYPSVQYTANASMDKDKDGRITIGDVKRVIDTHLPKRTAPASPANPVGALNPLIPAMVVGSLAAAYVYRKEIGQFLADTFGTESAPPIALPTPSNVLTNGKAG